MRVASGWLTILLVAAVTLAAAPRSAEAGRERRRTHDFRKVAADRRVSLSRVVVRRPIGEVFARATSTPVARVFPFPWRARTARPDATLAVGAEVEAQFAPIPAWPVRVPIVVTQVRRGESIAYDYQPGGISEGSNTIRFAASRDDAGRPVTIVTHRSEFRITAPFLRALPFVYEWVHRAFVAGLIRKLERP